MCGCLSCAPYGGPGPQPRHVPRLGIELVTLWFCYKNKNQTKPNQTKSTIRPLANDRHVRGEVSDVCPRL